MTNLILWVTMLLFPLLAFAQTAPPAAESTPPKRGSITGQILADDGQPLIGVGVNAIRTVGDRSVYRPAATDEEGKFKITDLPVGSYWLAPQVNGYVSASGSATRPRYHLGESATLTMIKGGVITGKVLDSAGQPLVGAMVNAQRVHDGEGRSSNQSNFTREAMSDDRGVYRIYGLDAGSYLVFVSGSYGVYYNDGIKESPTYHPNSTRDTAQEVTVQPGLTMSGIDIRHRGERGYVISGTFSGLAEGKGTNTNVSVHLMQADIPIANVGVNPRTTGKTSFALYGIADGEYELTARQHLFNRAPGEAGVASLARKVIVKGSDVTGIELRLLALASMAGRVVLEPGEKPDEKRTCPINRRGLLDEVILTYRRDDTDARLLGNTETAPDEKSEFKFQDVLPGRYRLNVQLPSDHWYLKAMMMPGATATAKPLDVASSGLTLKLGENLTGLTLTVAEGAAGVSGRIVAEKDKSLPIRLRVYLVPAEKEAAAQVLRYSEVFAKADGAFTFTNLAPGKYWLVTRPVPDDESDEKPAKPVAWDTAARIKLRTEAEAANNVIELTSCQRVRDYALSHKTSVQK